MNLILNYSHPQVILILIIVLAMGWIVLVLVISVENSMLVGNNGGSRLLYNKTQLDYEQRLSISKV